MKRPVLILAAALLSGCVLSPDPEPERTPLAGVAAFAGCYQNAGEPSEASSWRFLSSLFWPDNAIPPAQIEQIEVEPLSASVVRIRALAAGKVLTESDFREGEHFTREPDRLLLSGNWGSSLAAPADNPFTGAYHERISLWLDTQGDGRLTDESTFAGTAFLIIPIAGSVSAQRRFARLGDRCVRL